MSGQFANFCHTFVTHFEDETDERARFQRFAALLVAEVTSVAGLVRYTELQEGEDPLILLRTALRPTLEQEGLWAIAPAFFGGVCVEDVELLLEEVATFVEDPDGYVAPDLPGQDDEEEEEEEQEANG
jgi:hypothetical protein